MLISPNSWASQAVQWWRLWPANAGDAGMISGSGRSSGEGHGNPLQYSCLGNVMVRGAWWAAVHGVTNSQTEHARSYLCKHASYSYLRLLTTQVFKLQTWVPFLTLHFPLIREMSTLVCRICFKILQQRGLSVWDWQMTTEIDKCSHQSWVMNTCVTVLFYLLFFAWITGTTLPKWSSCHLSLSTLNSNSIPNSSAILLNNLVLNDFYWLCPKVQTIAWHPNLFKILLQSFSSCHCLLQPHLTDQYTGLPKFPYLIFM